MGNIISKIANPTFIDFYEYAHNCNTKKIYSLYNCNYNLE